MPKKRRGPKPTGKGHMIGVRVQPPLMKSLDRFIKKQPGTPSRPEAIRMILTDALTSYGLFPLDLPPPIKRDAN
jgi:hypothetical protein